MPDFAVKDATPPIRIECPARIRLHANAGARGALVKRLARGRLLIWLDQQVSEGSVFDLTVEPSTELTPQVQVGVRVLRCTPIAQSEGSFAVVCRLEQLGT